MRRSSDVNHNNNNNTGKNGDASYSGGHTTDHNPVLRDRLRAIAMEIDCKYFGCETKVWNNSLNCTSEVELRKNKKINKETQTRVNEEDEKEDEKEEGNKEGDTNAVLFNANNSNSNNSTKKVNLVGVAAAASAVDKTNVYYQLPPNSILLYWVQMATMIISAILFFCRKKQHHTHYRGSSGSRRALGLGGTF